MIPSRVSLVINPERAHEKQDMTIGPAQSQYDLDRTKYRLCLRTSPAWAKDHVTDAKRTG